MSTPLTRVLTVGGNPISAFLSWRLSATNACDVTLVWKSGYEAVSQYGISFKYVSTPPHHLDCIPSNRPCSRSKLFGNERFKPRQGTCLPETYRLTFLTLPLSCAHT